MMAREGLYAVGVVQNASKYPTVGISSFIIAQMKSGVV